MSIPDEKEYDSASIWRSSRAASNKSQEYMANYIGVARKTIQNWESGVSAPNFVQGTQWFEALGINPLPYFLQYIYPETMAGIKASDSDEKIEAALQQVIADLPIEGKRQLLYLFFGKHGSSPNAALNLLTAHLQVPIKDRIIQATSVIENYEIERDLGNLVCPEHIQPDVDKIRNAINGAKNAVRDNKESYNM